MKLSDYDYHLPQELIAQHPLPQRDQSRLMVLHRTTEKIEHCRFKQIVGYLKAGDCLVVNETRVLPARLLGEKEHSGGGVEVFLTRQIETDTWEALVRPGRRVPVGTVILFAQGRLRCEVLERTADGKRVVRFNGKENLNSELQSLGQIPLPPYIRRDPDPDDSLKYQTVYARIPGAVAAPTAGLHFTSSVLDDVEEKGVEIAAIVLHVGVGSFRPVVAQNPEEHKMDAEYFRISEQAAEKINRAKREGGRVVAVGTSTVRALESNATAQAEHYLLKSGSGWTDKFIHPPYQFKLVDVLATNFHLSCSTLLMLISAFAERSFILKAYQEAIREEYRFLSFGDAMLIL